MTDDTQSQPILALNEALAIGFETADFSALRGLYTEGSVLLPPRSRAVRGGAAIVAFWTGVRNRFASMAFNTGEFKDLGSDVARETGTYEMMPGEGGGAPVSGKFMIVWLKVEDAWRVESSIWSRNAEPGQRQQGQAGTQGGRASGAGPRQGGQQGSGQQGGGQPGGGQGGYRQGGYGGGGRNRGGIGGQQGGIGGGGSGLGGGGRRANPQQGGRRGQGGTGGQGGGGGRSLYDDNMGLYSNRDD